MKYKVWVIADSSGKWCTNSLEFDTVDKAADYARDLSCRWTAVREWQVQPTDQDPNSPVLGPEGVIA